MVKLSLIVVTLVLAAGCGKDDPKPAPNPNPADTSKLSRPPELPRPPAGKLPDDLRPPKE